MNKQNEFKAGDLVYFPQVSNKIFKLEDPGISEYYPLIIANDPYPMCFTSEGKMSFEHERQTIFHATEENCELLSSLYGVEFEKPKPRPTPRQVIEDRLARASFAPCLVGDRYDWDAMALIVCVKDDKDGNVQYIDGVGNVWHDAQLIDDNENEIWEIEE